MRQRQLPIGTGKTKMWEKNKHRRRRAQYRSALDARVRNHARAHLNAVNYSYLFMLIAKNEICIQKINNNLSFVYTFRRESISLEDEYITRTKCSHALAIVVVVVAVLSRVHRKDDASSGATGIEDWKQESRTKCKTTIGWLFVCGNSAFGSVLSPTGFSTHRSGRHFCVRTFKIWAIPFVCVCVSVRG